VRLSAVRWDKGGGQAQATGLGRLAEVLLDARCGAGPSPVPHSLPVDAFAAQPFLLALAGGLHQRLQPRQADNRDGHEL
jgi:hypothetical protein